MNILYFVWAIIAGALLATMIHINGVLASFTTAVWASIVAHGVGTVTAAVVCAVITPSAFLIHKLKAPWWTYLGGLVGAIIVTIASTTVNSRIGISGTLSLMLLGQVLFGFIGDWTGVLGLEKRKVGLADFFQVLFVLTGAGIVVFFAR